MMTHNTSTCTWCNGEMDAALAHDAVVRVVGRPEKANFAPAGSSGQATADFPKPTEIAHFAKRKRPASRKYVVAEDNGVTKAVQQAVDDGCINAGPDDNQWDWRKPIVLASWGTREHSPATPQVLPNIETAVPGGGGGWPPNNLASLVQNTGWYQKIAEAMFKYGGWNPGVHEFKVTVRSDGNYIEGTLKIHAVGEKLWTPSGAAGAVVVDEPWHTTLPNELAIAMQTFAPRREIDGFVFDYYNDDHDPLAGRAILMLWDDPRGWFHGRVSRRERAGALKPGMKRLRECNQFMTWRILFARDARWDKSSPQDRTIAVDLPHSRRGPGDEQSDRGQWVLLSQVWIDGQRIDRYIGNPL
jgi:hypothetical protein